MEQLVPRHPNLSLLAYSEQKLSSRSRRFLLTYEKQSEPNDIINGTEKNQSDDALLENYSTDYNVEFRDRYFTNDLEARQKRRQRKAQVKEEGRQQALKRGKTIENGRVINRKPVKLPDN